MIVQPLKCSSFSSFLLTWPTNNQPTNHTTSSSWPRPFNTTMSSSKSATSDLCSHDDHISHILTTLSDGDGCLGNIKTKHQKTVAAMMTMMKIIILLLQEWGLSKQLPKFKLRFPSCSLLGLFVLGSGFLLFNFKCFSFFSFYLFSSNPEPSTRSLTTSLSAMLLPRLPRWCHGQHGWLSVCGSGGTCGSIQWLLLQWLLLWICVKRYKNHLMFFFFSFLGVGWGAGGLGGGCSRSCGQLTALVALL